MLLTWTVLYDLMSLLCRRSRTSYFCPELWVILLQRQGTISFFGWATTYLQLIMCIFTCIDLERQRFGLCGISYGSGFIEHPPLNDTEWAKTLHLNCNVIQWWQMYLLVGVWLQSKINLCVWLSCFIHTNQPKRHDPSEVCHTTYNIYNVLVR